jgi:hypothetical protein
VLRGYASWHSLLDPTLKCYALRVGFGINDKDLLER